ncbi:MAG TPA: undecaprenyl-phosphate glucose phosphotransferase, partial [Roseateles sp.]
MFEDRSYKRTFYSAPQSVESLIAAFLEPGLIVLTFLVVNGHFEEPVLRPALTLCLLVFALTFPGRNRFSDHPASALVDVLSSWLVLLGILLLCGYATNSLHYFENEVLLWWAIITPIAQIAAIETGRRIQKWR